MGQTSSKNPKKDSIINQVKEYVFHIRFRKKNYTLDEKEEMKLIHEAFRTAQFKSYNSNHREDLDLKKTVLVMVESFERPATSVAELKCPPNQRDNIRLRDATVKIQNFLIATIGMVIIHHLKAMPTTL